MTRNGGILYSTDKLAGKFQSTNRNIQKYWYFGNSIGNSLFPIDHS